LSIHSCSHWGRNQFQWFEIVYTIKIITTLLSHIPISLGMQYAHSLLIDIVCRYQLSSRLYIYLWGICTFKVLIHERCSCEVSRELCIFEMILVEYLCGRCQRDEVHNTSMLRRGVRFGGLPHHNSIILLLYVIYRWWVPRVRRTAEPCIGGYVPGGAEVVDNLLAYDIV